MTHTRLPRACWRAGSPGPLTERREQLSSKPAPAASVARKNCRRLGASALRPNRRAKQAESNRAMICTSEMVRKPGLLLACCCSRERFPTALADEGARVEVALKGAVAVWLS